MSAVLTDVIHIVLVFTTNYAAHDLPIYSSIMAVLGGTLFLSNKQCRSGVHV